MFIETSRRKSPSTVNLATCSRQTLHGLLGQVFDFKMLVDLAAATDRLRARPTDAKDRCRAISDAVIRKC